MLAYSRGLLLWLLLGFGQAWACAPAKPVKLVLRGTVMPAQQLAKELRLGLPCRLESSALACMCRPPASAHFEVVIGFRWKTGQMSDISSARMKELGEALRSIDGYSGATVKLVPLRAQDRAPRTMQAQRRSKVSDLLLAQVAPNTTASASAASSGRIGAPMPLVRWARQKIVINAAFV